MSVLLFDHLLGNVLVEENSFTLSTGAYDRAASSLGLFTTGDREFLKPYGTEGSAATISNLDTGTYSMRWSMYSKDKNGWDKLYAWNGKELSLIGDRSTGNQISTARWTHDITTATVDVLYDYVTFIAVDENSKTGTTEFTIEGFEYADALPYEAPKPITLIPTASLTSDFFHDVVNVSQYGTEGAAALWVTEPGIQQITWSVSSSESDPESD